LRNSSYFILFYFLLFNTVVSCNKKTFNTKEELFVFLKEEANNFSQSKSINGIDFNLMYRPTDLLIAQEHTDIIIEKEILKKLKNKYKNFIYFNLSLSKNNKEILTATPKTRTEFSALVNQLVFKMKDNVYLHTHESNDTIDMVDYIYPRLYGMTNNTTLMFVYPRKKEQLKGEFLDFVIKDIGLYTGDVKFKVPTTIINNEPQLLFKN